MGGEARGIARLIPRPRIDHFLSYVTSCFFLFTNYVELPGFSPRMYCMRYLDDISSLITIACCVPELRTIEFCLFPIENVLGGQNEISSKYLIQYILGENPGNPTLLIN